MTRLDQERQNQVEPRRVSSCADTLMKLGYAVESTLPNELNFVAKGVKVKLFPYSGWYSGKKPIGSGRGFAKLLKLLKQL